MSAVVTGTDHPTLGTPDGPVAVSLPLLPAGPGVDVDPLPRGIALAAAREVEGPCGTL